MAALDFHVEGPSTADWRARDDGTLALRNRHFSERSIAHTRLALGDAGSERGGAEGARDVEIRNNDRIVHAVTPMSSCLFLAHELDQENRLVNDKLQPTYPLLSLAARRVLGHLYRLQPLPTLPRSTTCPVIEFWQHNKHCNTV